MRWTPQERAGWAVAGIVIALSLFVGCRTTRRSANTIELWALGREGEVVARMIPEFERQHPGWQVRVQQIPWSAAHEKLLTAYVGGAMPDVLRAGNTWLPELVALGALEPLDERLPPPASGRPGGSLPRLPHPHPHHRLTPGLPRYAR